MNRIAAAISGCVLLLCGAGLSASRTGDRPAQPIANIDSSRAARIDAIFAPLSRVDSPGYAVGIIQRGKLVYARGFGSADLDHGIPITAGSAFNVASLSKQFTAASVGILIRRGLVSLEDDVRRHLPEFPAHWERVRVKHLVYMTSGLPEYYTLPRPGGRNWDSDYFTNADAIAAVLRQRELAFAPGTRWAYSNANYMLLAEIVRRVSGLSLADFAQREIFGPLGMSNTHFNDDLGRVVPHRVTGYNTGPAGTYRREPRHAPHFGGSGLFTTIEDLARWNGSFETHQLGGPELTALLLGTMKFAHPKSNDAFGLVWGEYGGRRTLWYEGGDRGFSSYMVRFPDDRLTVIVLSNLGTGRAAEHAGKVLDVLLADPG